MVEALTGDFAGNLEHVSVVAKSGLDVYAHNIETVEALTPYVRDRRATFRQSLSVLERAKKEGVRITKTSIMLGVGEYEEQVMDALRGETTDCTSASVIKMVFHPLELRKVDVDVVTFGQYMRPTKRHMKVDRYVEPAEFDRWRQIAEDMGFLYVASGPLVRSSYKVHVPVLGVQIHADGTRFPGRRVLHRKRLKRQGYGEADKESGCRPIPRARETADMIILFDI